MYNNVSYNFTYTWINCYNIKANDISYHITSFPGMVEERARERGYMLTSVQ